MDQFERQFENLDVQSDVMERAMGNSATLTTPTDQVDALLQEARSPTAGLPRRPVIPPPAVPAGGGAA